LTINAFAISFASRRPWTDAGGGFPSARLLVPAPLSSEVLDFFRLTAHRTVHVSDDPSLLQFSCTFNPPAPQISETPVSCGPLGSGSWASTAHPPDDPFPSIGLPQRLILPAGTAKPSRPRGARYHFVRLPFVLFRLSAVRRASTARPTRVPERCFPLILFLEIGAAPYVVHKRVFPRLWESAFPPVPLRPDFISPV